jgi:hypothetical protein
MSFLPPIVTIIAIILATSIIDIEAGLRFDLLAALTSLQRVSGNKFKQPQRQIETDHIPPHNHPKTWPASCFTIIHLTSTHGQIN